MTARLHRTTRRADEAGFSLIEAVIALAIIAAMVAALLFTVTGDARARMMVRQRRTALMVAQSQLDLAGSGQAGDSGQLLDLTWHIDRESYAQSEAFAQNRLEQLTVTVEDADHHQLARLATVRIVP